MTNTNDQRILDMKKQIEDKKDKLGKATRFMPITNCSIELDKVRYNLNVLDKNDLIHLAVKLQSYLISAKTLDLSEQYLISGYSPADWITDIMSKIDILSKKDEEKTLKSMEEKLSKLLSDGKRVELEIDAFESMLK